MAVPLLMIVDELKNLIYREKGIEVERIRYQDKYLRTDERFFFQIEINPLNLIHIEEKERARRGLLELIDFADINFAV